MKKLFTLLLFIAASAGTMCGGEKIEIGGILYYIRQVPMKLLL